LAFLNFEGEYFLLKNKDGAYYSIYKLLKLMLMFSGFIFLFGGVWLTIGNLSSTVLQIIIILSLFLSISISVILFEKKSLVTVGIQFRIKDVLFLLLGVSLAVILILSIFLVVILIKQDDSSLSIINQLYTIKRLPLSYLMIPFIEEMIFRGYMLNNMFLTLNFKKRSIITSVLFMLPHLIIDGGNVSMMTLIFAMGIGTFLFGMFFNNVTHLSNSIWVSLGFHWIYNFLFSTFYLDSSNYYIGIVCTITFLLIGTLVTRKMLIKRGRY